MRLILVRHPQPLAAPGLCYGSTDLPAAPDQLDQVALELSASLPSGAALISSPLQRCAALARRLQITVAPSSLSYDKRLVEMDFGAWEMQAWDSIARAEVDAWANDMAGYRPGGGESVLRMAHRVADFYADLRLQAQPTSIVICHAGTMRLLLARHAGLAPADMALQAAQTPHQIAYGGMLELDCR